MTTYKETDQYREDVAAIIRGLEEVGTTRAALAKSSGVSTAQVTDVLNFKYPKVTNTHTDNLFAGLDRLREQNIGTPVVDTSVLRLITDICNEAFSERHEDGIGLFTGYPGIGKTTAFKYYCQRHPFAVYIRASIGMSKTTLLDALARAMSISLRGHTLSQRQYFIGDYLRRNPRLLILDEANRGSRFTLETLRDLADDSSSALVLAGREFLHEQLSANTGQYGEISSRILTWVDPVRALTEDDIYLIINASPLADLNDECKEMIWECCAANARTLSHLIKRLSNFRKRKKTELTPKIISQIFHKAVRSKSAAWRSHH